MKISAVPSSRKMVHFAVKGTPLKPQTAPKTGHHQLAKDTLLQIPFRIIVWDWKLQVKLCQKHLFLQQLTQNISKACSLNYKFSTWKLQALNMLCTQIDFLVFYWHSEQFMYTTCSELGIFMYWTRKLLKKIYLYHQGLRSKICKLKKWFCTVRSSFFHKL